MRFKLLGFGAVGQAINKIFSEANHDVFIHDPALGYKCSLENNKAPFDAMLVCIPFSDNFIQEVLRAKGSINKVIVFSTVPIGTTAVIPNAIHVPVEGPHDELYTSLKHWNVMVGIDDGNIFKDEYFRIIVSVFKVNVWSDTTRTTEACKLLSTLLYGVNIEFMRYANVMLQGRFHAFNAYNVAYNKLYEDLNIKAARYILQPPKGDIGGHCVRQNTKLLPESIFTKIVYYRYDNENINREV